MSADKAHIQETYREFNDCNQAIVVSHDVEHISLVPDGIHGIEIPLDVSIACPSTCFNHSSPHLHGHKRIRMQFRELFDGLFRENPHRCHILVAKVRNHIEITKFISNFSKIATKNQLLGDLEGTPKEKRLMTGYF